MSSMNCAERIRDKFARGELCVGTGVSFGDSVVSELLGEAGFDFLFVDGEHSPLSLADITNHVIAARAAQTAVWVRVNSCDENVIKPVVDMHPAGIIVPRVCTADEAAIAVAACRYPPMGRRGFGPMRGVRFGAVPVQPYLKDAAREPLVILQIEDIEAVRHLDAILATPGVGAIMIGPNDLSGSMGLLGQTTHDDVVQAVDRIILKSCQQNVPVGVSCAYEPQRARQLIDLGVSFLSFNGDWGMLYAQAKFLVDAVAQIQSPTKA